MSHYQIGRIRHLVYHLYPHRLNEGAIWRRNVAEVRKRISLFNGRRVIALALDRDTDSREVVEHELAGMGMHIIPIRNQKDLREGASLVQLYEQVEPYQGVEHVTLHAHGKGITSEAWAGGAKQWGDTLYETCLDYWPRVQQLLQDYPTVGPFFRRYSQWSVPGFKSRSTWHFSGSFRWFRNADMFARNWRYVEPFWCGSESHPSMVFRPDEAANIVHEIRTPGRALYERTYWDGTAGPALSSWRVDHAAQRQAPLLLTCVLVSHRKPQRVHDAVASLVSQSCPDWQLVIIDSGSLVEDLRRYESDPRIRVYPSRESEFMGNDTAPQAWCINQAWGRGLVLGDLVTYLSDDDYYSPGLVGSWSSVARQQPGQSAWVGYAHRHAVGGDGRITDLGTLRPGRIGDPLDCRVDGMQVCHRREVVCPWPEEPAVAWHADGVWMERLRALVPVHPVDVRVGWHRHCPESVYTTDAAATSAARGGGK